MPKLPKTFQIRAISPLLALPLLSCGSAATTDTSGLSNLIGSMAVTSPTASATTTSFFQNKQSLFAKLFAPFAFAEETTAPTDVKPFGTMVADTKSDLASSDPTAVAAKIGNMSVTSYRAGCFGPAWTDNATGSSVSRPSGDLGMVAASASTTDTTACSAAQLNSLLGGAPQFANKVIKLQAALIAGLRKNSIAPPAKGASVDGLSSMPTVPKLTFTVAKAERLADRSDGNAVYKTTFAFTDSSSKAGTVTIYHTPKNTDNTNFTGLIQAVLPHTATGGGAGTKRGMSMVYDQTDGVFTYALDTAANRSTDSSDFFSTTTGRVDFTKAAFGEDGNRIIASVNSTTNATTMHYAWQAGSMDGAVRAFAISIPAGTDGALTGVAYFGYGAAISTLTDTVSTPWMTKMFCNWLAGLSGGTSQAVVQGQTIQQDSTKKFIAASSKIEFAPNNTCSSASFVISGSTPSDYNGTRTNANPHNMTTVGGLGTIPAVTVPTYTVPTS